MSRSARGQPRPTRSAQQPVVAAAAAVLVTAAAIAVGQTLGAQAALPRTERLVRPGRHLQHASRRRRSGRRQASRVRESRRAPRAPRRAARPPPRPAPTPHHPGRDTRRRQHPAPTPPRPPRLVAHARPPAPSPVPRRRPHPSPSPGCAAVRRPRPRRRPGRRADLPARRAAPDRPAALPDLPCRGAARQRRSRRRDRGTPARVPGGRPGHLPRRPRRREPGLPAERGGGVGAAAKVGTRRRPRGSHHRGRRRAAHGARRPARPRDTARAGPHRAPVHRRGRHRDRAGVHRRAVDRRAYRATYELRVTDAGAVIDGTAPVTVTVADPRRASTLESPGQQQGSPSGTTPGSAAATPPATTPATAWSPSRRRARPSSAPPGCGLPFLHHRRQISGGRNVPRRGRSRPGRDIGRELSAIDQLTAESRCRIRTRYCRTASHSPPARPTDPVRRTSRQPGGGGGMTAVNCPSAPAPARRASPRTRPRSSAALRHERRDTRDHPECHEKSRPPQRPAPTRAGTGSVRRRRVRRADRTPTFRANAHGSASPPRWARRPVATETTTPKRDERPRPAMPWPHHGDRRATYTMTTTTTSIAPQEPCGQPRGTQSERDRLARHQLLSRTAPFPWPLPVRRKSAKLTAQRALYVS